MPKNEEVEKLSVGYVPRPCEFGILTALNKPVPKAVSDNLHEQLDVAHVLDSGFYSPFSAPVIMLLG